MAGMRRPGAEIVKDRGKAKDWKVWVERFEGLCPGDFFGDPSPFDYAQVRMTAGTCKSKSKSNSNSNCECGGSSPSTGSGSG